nr:MAG TPA: hypothetical protein [Caudoviricetes sp.]
MGAFLFSIIPQYTTIYYFKIFSLYKLVDILFIN